MGLKVLRSGKVDSKPEKKEKHFDILEAEAQHLLALANKVLTISKLEHGQLLLDKNWIQLRPMVDELVHTFTAKAEKPITFQVDLQAEGAYADEEYLKEALSNLIDNAVKYSKDTIDIQITSCFPDSIFRSGCGIMESVFRLRLNGLYLISLNASLPGMRMRRRKYPVSVWD